MQSAATNTEGKKERTELSWTTRKGVNNVNFQSSELYISFRLTGMMLTSSFTFSFPMRNYNLGLNLREGWGLAVLSRPDCHVGAQKGVDSSSSTGRAEHVQSIKYWRIFGSYEKLYVRYKE